MAADFIAVFAISFEDIAGNDLTGFREIDFTDFTI